LAQEAGLLFATDNAGTGAKTNFCLPHKWYGESRKSGHLFLVVFDRSKQAKRERRIFFFFCAFRRRRGTRRQIS
jgi:hypothetical protein